ncbi:MAG: glycosyltransferase family 2 protein [Thermodesulfobacteriota bacterium]
MRISVVIPVYNSAVTIGRLVDDIARELSEHDFQVVLVNDCSRDHSDEVCRGIYAKYRGKITYLKLARNFGEHNAVMAGLNYATGDYIVIMDDDFQNPPDEVLQLAREAERGSYDAVYSYYEKKEHSWFRNLGSAFNNWVANFMLDKPRDLYLSSFKCMNRFLVNEIVKYVGTSPYIDGLIFSCTSNVGRVKVRHDPRENGRSGYTFAKLIRLWSAMFVNFSILPLQLCLVLGLCMSVIAGVLAVAVVVERLITPDFPAIGWASLATMILLFSGVQLCMIGVLGEYVGNTLLNTNRLPQFVVGSVLERNSDHERVQTP